MARTLTASDRKTLIKLASTLPVGSPERKVILAGLSKQGGLPDGNLPDGWADAYLRWFDGVVGLVGDLDGGMVERLSAAISGNTGYPRSARKEVRKVISDFESRLLKKMDSWDREQKSMGVAFKE